MPTRGAGRVGDPACGGGGFCFGGLKNWGPQEETFTDEMEVGLFRVRVAGWGRASLPGPLPPASFGGLTGSAWAGSQERQVEPQDQRFALLTAQEAPHTGVG